MLAALQMCATQFVAPGADLADFKGERWARVHTNYSLFNTIQTPNDNQYRFGSCKFGTGGIAQAFSSGASSGHPGGVNVAMGDGSVRFIKDSVSRDVWWGLGTKAGGEILSADSY